jgi:hypothetical protein
MPGTFVPDVPASAAAAWRRPGADSGVCTRATWRRGHIRRASSAPHTTNGNGVTSTSWPADRAAVPNTGCSMGVYTSTKANTISTAMPPSSAGLLNTPIARSEACSVRAANAVPIWQATIPSQATVVAC